MNVKNVPKTKQVIKLCHSKTNVDSASKTKQPYICYQIISMSMANNQLYPNLPKHLEFANVSTHSTISDDKSNIKNFDPSSYTIFANYFEVF